MTRLIIQLMNDEAVYRTAPATPGLLNIVQEQNICDTLYPRIDEKFTKNFRSNNCTRESI